MQKINKKIMLIIATTAMLILASSLTFAADPVLFFSDLISGPKTSWSANEPNKGAAVTIWGKNFGSSRSSSYVTVNGAQLTSASDYAEWGVVGHVPGLERITFWLNSSCQNGSGQIKVTVNDTTSNALPFTVREGAIYFASVNALQGKGDGSFNNPWHPADWYDNMDAGDTCYFRAGTYTGKYGYPWSANFYFYVGTGDGYCNEGTDGNRIGFVAYPGETVTFQALAGDQPSSNFRIYAGPVGDPGDTAGFFIISKFNLEAWINCARVGPGWRIIGNDCRGLTADSGIWTGTIGSRSTGGGLIVLGNTVHGGRTGDKHDHAIYPGGCASEGYEIGWNYIYDNNFARGPLVSANHYGNNCGESEYLGDYYIHDNIIDCTDYPSRAIGSDLNYNIGDPVEPIIHIYNNILINCGITDDAGDHAAVRHQNSHAKIYNNTFYDTKTYAVSISRYSSQDGSTAPALNVYMKNNIFHMKSEAKQYLSISSSWTGTLDLDSNCYYGLGDYSGTDDKNPVNGDPQFEDAGNNKFQLRSHSPCIGKGSSAVSAIVTRDFDGNPRPQGDGYDIGAYEFAGPPPEGPEIHLSATSHDYPSVQVGNSSDWKTPPLAISNLGTEKLIVSSVASDIGDFTVISPAFPQDINAGASIDVIVRFSPSSAGAISGNLTINSNDADESSLNVSLSGTGSIEQDTTPPADVSDFTATAGDGHVTLSWTNPADSDFAGTMIRYRTDGAHPVNHSDGILVCDRTTAPGSEDSFTHTELQNGTTYYYSAFTYDEVPNYSETVHASATPTASANVPPTASFNANPSSGEAPLIVQFTDTSTDPDGTIVCWDWEFGDGATSTAQNPSHTYNTAGTYTATLTVTDDDDATDSASVTISVSSPGNQPPSASFDADPTAGDAPLTVQFTDTSTDPDGTIVSWNWNSGDGATSTAQNPSHTYNTAGNYTATLTVTDDDDATDSASTTISVSSPGEKVSIYIEAESGTLSSPMVIGNHPDPQPCAGEYIYAPAGSGDTTDPTAEAVYTVEIPYAGDYYLWLRMHGPTDDNDAMYIGFNDNFDRVYGSQYEKYEWVRVETVDGSGIFAHTLSAGTNQINIGHGEELARADMIFVTDDPDSRPVAPPQNVTLTVH